MRGHTPCYHCLHVVRGDGLVTVKSQPAGASGQRSNRVKRHAQRFVALGQHRAVKGIRARNMIERNVWHIHLDLALGDDIPVSRAQPAVVCPFQPCKCGIEAENTALFLSDRPTAEIDHVGSAIRGLGQGSVSRTLQRCVGCVPRGQHGQRIGLVRPLDLPCACQAHTVVI